MELSIKKLERLGVEYYKASVKLANGVEISTTRMSWDASYRWLEKTARQEAARIQTKQEET